MAPATYYTIQCNQDEVYPDFKEIDKLLTNIYKNSTESSIDIKVLSEQLMDLYTILHYLPFYPNKLILMLLSKYNIITVLINIMNKYGSNLCVIPIIEANGKISDVITELLQMYMRATTDYKPHIVDTLIKLANSDDVQVVKDSINGIKKIIELQQIDLENFYICIAMKIKLETNMKELNSVLELLITLVEDSDTFPLGAVEMCTREATSRISTLKKDSTTRKTHRLLKSLIELASDE